MHAKSKGCKRHSLRSIEYLQTADLLSDSLRDKYRKCPTHPELTEQYYCRQCMIAVCLQCFQQHPGHRLGKFEGDTLKRFKRKINLQAEIEESVLADLDTQLKTTYSDVFQLLSNVDDVESFRTNSSGIGSSTGQNHSQVE